MERAILIDTSAWIEALRADGDEETRRAVGTVIENGTAVFCDMVRLELWAGARGERERKYLGVLEHDLECLPITAEVWSLSRDLARRSRKQGLSVPATDLLVFACASHHAAGMLHRDRHFELLGELARR